MVNVLLSSYSEWPKIHSTEFYDSPEYIGGEFWKITSTLSQLGLQASCIDREARFTTKLWERSLAVFHTHVFGAQLPPHMEADALWSRIHPKPRVILVTDYVETVT
jgi:hypothetical protein